MKKLFVLFFLIVATPLFIFGAETPKAECRYPILVSIAPHKFFIDRITGGKVGVSVMVPPGSNAHTYEPTAKQVMQQSCANLWFQIGESFEKKATPAMLAHRPSLKVIDLRQGINMIRDQHCCSHCKKHDCEDPHIWLSPKEAKHQAKTILNALIAEYPDSSAEFKKNYDLFINDLEALDQEITTMLAPVKGRSFMVSHPAYAYFSRDYGLVQLSVEFEGKDPSPQQLTQTLRLAKERGIKTIFIQMQFNNKGARLIAQQIGAQVVTLDPYEENFIENMRRTARGFSNP